MAARTPDALRDALLSFALGLPGAFEDHPWGERVAKVNKKVFAFFGTPEGNAGGFGMSVKLPSSQHAALSLPCCEPTGYGLGKSGWVSVRFARGALPPYELCAEWVVESYRAVAPKKLVATLAGDGAAPAPRPAPRKKAAAPAAKRPVAKKAAAPAAKRPAAKKAAASGPEKRTRR